MKSYFYLIISLIIISACVPTGGTPTPANATITVNGKHIIAPCGDTIVPKGVTIIEDGDVLVVTGDNLEQISL